MGELSGDSMPQLIPTLRRGRRCVYRASKSAHASAAISLVMQVGMDRVVWQE